MDALAKGMDPKILMAELYGKQDGCCGGRGGTMHLYDREVGLFGTNGLVGGDSICSWSWLGSTAQEDTPSR